MDSVERCTERSKVNRREWEGWHEIAMDRDDSSRGRNTVSDVVHTQQGTGGGREAADICAVECMSYTFTNAEDSMCFMYAVLAEYS